MTQNSLWMLTEKHYDSKNWSINLKCYVIAYLLNKAVSIQYISIALSDSLAKTKTQKIILINAYEPNNGISYKLVENKKITNT